MGNLSLDRPIPFDPYEAHRETGGFVLVDRLSNHTVGAGLLHFALRRSENVHWQAMEVDRGARAALKGQQPVRGLVHRTVGRGEVDHRQPRRDSGSTPSGAHTYLLDGDNVRHGLSKNLGFSDADRVENIRRVAEVASLMADAGLIVLVSLISPFEAERQMARELIGDDQFCEVFVDTPLAVAEERDVKGLYGKARRGELTNFTGVDSPYEVPRFPDIRIDTTQVAVEDGVEQVIEFLRGQGAIPR